MTDSAATDQSVTGQTLEEIEGQRWGDPPGDASYLIARCYALRRVPLAKLGIEDLRILLGQSIGVPTLAPLALRVLAHEPLAEGDFYPGDLLAALLRLDQAYWSAHADQRAELAGIARRVDVASDDLISTDVPRLVAEFLTG